VSFTHYPYRLSALLGTTYGGGCTLQEKDSIYEDNLEISERLKGKESIPNFQEADKTARLRLSTEGMGRVVEVRIGTMK